MMRMIAIIAALMVFLLISVSVAQSFPPEHLQEIVFNPAYPFRFRDPLPKTFLFDRGLVVVFADFDDVRIIGVHPQDVGHIAHYVVCDVERRIMNGMPFALMWPVRAHLFSVELRWLGSGTIEHTHCIP